MAEPAGRRSPRPERADLARALGRLDEPLTVLAEDILGLDARIDCLARDGRGQVVLVFAVAAGEDLARLGDVLAQHAWAEPRVADWAQLAPALSLRPELGVRALLLAPRFDPRTRLAVGALGADRVALGTLRGGQGETGEPRVEIEGGAVPSSAPPRPRSRFRTGLSAADL